MTLRLGFPFRYTDERRVATTREEWPEIYEEKKHRNLREGENPS